MDPAGKESMNSSLLVCLCGCVRHGSTARMRDWTRKPTPMKKAAGGTVSCEDFKGSAHAFREFMRRERDAIERGERLGVSVRWASADPRHTLIGWVPPTIGAGARWSLTGAAR